MSLFFRFGLVGSLLLWSVVGLSQGALVQGQVQEASGPPLPGAQVLLLHLPDSAVAAAQPTDGQGAYTFGAVAAGHYCVRAQLLGYEPARSSGFTVESSPITLPALQLQASATALREVVVQGRAPVLEQQIDRTVLNVERLNTAGESALEVLGRAPGVQLDANQNLRYRGSAGVLILLNGKKTYLSEADLTSYLKSLPASAVSQIELIPNPPASMEAAGTAGVINIRLRRHQLPGLGGTASLSLGHGRYEKAAGSANLSYNRGPLRVFSNGSAGRYNSFNRLVIVRNIRDTTYRQVNYWQPLTHSADYLVGAEVDVARQHTLGLQLRGSLDQTRAAVDAHSETLTGAGQRLASVQMDNPRTSRVHHLGLTLNYRWQLDSAGHELRADADYVTYGSAARQQFANQFFLPISEQPYAATYLRNALTSQVAVRAATLDYVRPFAGTPWRLEAGAKASWVTNRSRLASDELHQDTWQLDTLRTNAFQLDETILAGYLSLSTTLLSKLEVKGGLRGEHTRTLGESATTGQRVARSYTQLFPSLFATYTLAGQHAVAVSVSRRINRPAYQNLNPFLTYTDAYTAIQGNPFLGPSLAWSWSGTYTYKSFQVASLSYLRETQVISQVTYQNDQTKLSTSTPQNLDQAETLSLSSGGHSELTAWWSMDNQITGSYGRLRTRLNDQPVRVASFSASISSSHSFRLPRQLKLQVEGAYYSPGVNNLFRMKAAGALNLGLSRPLWQDRATLSLKATDLFFTSRWRSTLRYTNVDMIWNNQYESRRVTLKLQYKIGSGKTHTGRPTGSTDEQRRL